MRTERPRQRDLFDGRSPLPEMMPAQRAKVTALLQVLLIEAAAGRAAESRDRVNEEVRDDEDCS
jgi:hypothetical protein